MCRESYFRVGAVGLLGGLGFDYAGVRAHAEAVQGLVGLAHLLRVQGDVEGFQRVQGYGGEFGGNAGGELFVADFGREVVQGLVVCSVDDFLGTVGGGRVSPLFDEGVWFGLVLRCFHLQGGSVFDSQC